MVHTNNQIIETIPYEEIYPVQLNASSEIEAVPEQDERHFITANTIPSSLEEIKTIKQEK